MPRYMPIIGQGLKALPYIRVLATKSLVGQGSALPEPSQNPMPFVFNFTRIR